MNLPADLPFSPAADRNKQPILERLQSLLPAQAQVLEVASGTGQHAAHFVAAQPGWQWQPTEVGTEALSAIASRCEAWPQVLPPLQLDVVQQPWALAPEGFDAIYCANMLHASPWATCAGLMQGAATHLRAGGLLLLYGPYRVAGKATPGNLAFDADLRAKDPRWGLRELSAVQAQAAAVGLVWQAHHDMPANNLLLVFQKA